MNLAGKKIACFVALAHHTRFLLPITDQILKKGGEVIFFLPLSDYPFELELTRLKYPFKYIQDYIRNKEKEQIKTAYNGLMDTLSSRFSQWDGVKTWPLFEQERSVSACIEECFGVETFLKEEKPDLIIALHERNRWGKIIGHYANRDAIPFVTLQEGDYHESRLSFSAHTEFSTANLLWGSATKETLVKHYCSEDKISMVGNTHLDTAIKQYTKPKRLKKIRAKYKFNDTKKIVLVLVDLEYGAIIEAKIWEIFLSNLPKKVQLVIKWHPNVKRQTYVKIEKMIKAINPKVRMMYTEDAYELLAVADYCVTLGKTTLALEAVAYGKPLFAYPSWTSKQEYYADKGVAQALKPLGDWTALEDTLKNGVPENLAEAVEAYLSNSFYRLDGKAVMRVLEVIEFLIDKRRASVDSQLKPIQYENEMIKGRVSFILPIGYDAEAFVATVTSLGQHVEYADWQLIVVNHQPDTESLLDGLGGDVQIVESEAGRLAELYNQGAMVANGEVLIFLQPGILYARGETIPELAKQGLVAIPINDAEMKPYCLGVSFDFNYTPFNIVDQQFRLQAAGGGALAISREHFSLIGGFDQSLDNRYVEVDLSLAASKAGMTIVYAKDDLFVFYKGSFDLGMDNDHWQGRLGFFAKWLGSLPKNDNFAQYAKELMVV